MTRRTVSERCVEAGPGDAMVAMAREFAIARIRPLANDLDAEEAYPASLYKEMADLGMFGITVPEDCGGLGAKAVDYAHIMEELSFGYSSVADQVGVVEIVASLIARYGSTWQGEHYLKPTLAGDKRCAYALTEPQAGSDLGGIRTFAAKTADGWRLSGEKVYIHNAPVADFAVVLAISDPERGRRGGMSTFLVDLRTTPGVSTPHVDHKMGQRASQLGSIVFENAALSSHALLGEEGHAYGYMAEVLAKGRLGIAGLCLGISRAALEAATSYANSREQFGRRIGSYQAVAFALADMAVEYQAGRALVNDAARQLDCGEDAKVACSMAKLYASEACIRHSSAAVQIHGGSGYIRGIEVERLYRDARITSIYEGTSEVQRLIISRSLLGPSSGSS